MINLDNIFPDFTFEILLKGGKPAAIGEIRTWNGKKFQKTAEGWVLLKKDYVVEKDFSPLKSTKSRWIDEEGNWKKERVEKVHKPIIDSYVNDERVVPKKNPTVYLMMGAPASGKGSVRRSFGGKYVEVDPDDIKTHSLKEDFDRYSKYNKAVAAQKVHEEGSYLAKTIINQLTDKRTDFLIDKTFTDWKKLSSTIEKFQKAGYNVEVYLAWCPKKEADKRRLDRFKKTGRNVPKTYFDKSHNQVLATFDSLINKKYPNVKKIRKVNTFTNKVEYDSVEN